MMDGILLLNVGNYHPGKSTGIVYSPAGPGAITAGVTCYNKVFCWENIVGIMPGDIKTATPVIIIPLINRRNIEGQCAAVTGKTVVKRLLSP